MILPVFQLVHDVQVPGARAPELPQQHCYNLRRPAPGEIVLAIVHLEEPVFFAGFLGQRHGLLQLPDALAFRGGRLPVRPHGGGSLGGLGASLVCGDAVGPQFAPPGSHRSRVWAPARLAALCHATPATRPGGWRPDGHAAPRTSRLEILP